ncbi:MAG: 7TM domain-containing protein [Candidatus Gracilibacteria bacterium]|jgi:hypothetical protein
MFKVFFLALFSAFLWGNSVLAVELPEEAAAQVESEIYAEIDSVDSIGVDRNIIFSGASSESISDGALRFEWHFGDGNRQEGSEVVHSYAQAGEYAVTLTVRDPEGREASVSKTIFAFSKSFVLVSTVTDEDEKLLGLVTTAREQGIYIDLLSASTHSGFLEEEELRRQLLEKISSLENTEDLLIYTSGTSGLTVLSQLQESLGDEAPFKGKNVIFISEHSLGAMENIARGVYSTIQSQQIVLTRPEALWVLLEAENVLELTQILEERGIEYTVVDKHLEIRPWNFLSVLVNNMLSHGVPTNTILLVLMLPIIATVIAFMKQVVGLNTLGIYTPSILSLSFIALNLWYGLLVFVILFLVASLARSLLHRYRLLYIPRMAIILSISSFAILLVLFLGSLFDQKIDQLAIFPILIMATMVEKFVTIQSDKGMKNAMRIGGEVLLVAMLCSLVAQWNILEIWVLGHPELVLLCLPFNLFLARWAGLRLVEYIRFREIIHHIEE